MKLVRYSILKNTFNLKMPLLLFISILISEPSYAYRECNVLGTWAEKANYSECLTLIGEIPQYEVKTKFSLSCRNDLFPAASK